MKRALYRKIPCYFNPSTNELIGTNMFYDILVWINIFIDFYLVGLTELPVEVLD